jgi:hypothetical protein
MARSDPAGRASGSRSAIPPASPSSGNGEYKPEDADAFCRAVNYSEPAAGVARGPKDARPCVIPRNTRGIARDVVFGIPHAAGARLTHEHRTRTQIRLAVL